MLLLLLLFLFMLLLLLLCVWPGPRSSGQALPTTHSDTPGPSAAASARDEGQLSDWQHKPAPGFLEGGDAPARGASDRTCPRGCQKVWDLILGKCYGLLLSFGCSVLGDFKNIFPHVVLTFPSFNHSLALTPLPGLGWLVLCRAWGGSGLRWLGMANTKYFKPSCIKNI